MWENAYLSTENPRARDYIRLALLTGLSFATLAIVGLGRNLSFSKNQNFLL